MRQVVIGFDDNGNPYVVSKPTKVEVIFKQPKPRTLRKRVRTLLYKLRKAVQ